MTAFTIIIRAVSGDTGQLVLVFAACVLMLAGWIAPEIARKRRLDRLDREAAARAGTRENAARRAA